MSVSPPRRLTAPARGPSPERPSVDHTSPNANRRTPQEADHRLVDAATLAAILGVSRDYIYRHAATLAAIRLGTGPRARLRFDPVAALDVLAARSGSERAQPPESPVHGAPAPPRRRRARPGARVRAPGARTPAGAPLLPIVGEGSRWR